MYPSRPESNEATSVTLERNGKKPTSWLSVDMDEPLKAGHAREPERDMQFCAIDVEMKLARRREAALGDHRDPCIPLRERLGEAISSRPEADRGSRVVDEPDRYPKVLCYSIRHPLSLYSAKMPLITNSFSRRGLSPWLVGGRDAQKDYSRW